MGMRATVSLVPAELCRLVDAGVWDALDIEPDSSVDLDKAWHAIHYLITGDSNLGFLLSGKQHPLVANDEAFVEYHSPSTVSVLWNDLSETSITGIMDRLDYADFDSRDIYPGGWPELELGDPYIFPHMDAFIKLVQKAYESKYGLLVQIT